MNEKKANGMDNWSFPDVNFDEAGIQELDAFTEEFHFISDDENSAVNNEPKLSDEALERKNSENDLLELKSAYENKLKVVNNLIDRIQNSVAIIDTEIVHMINDIINKVSKKIIYREIQANPNLVTKMINELKTIVPFQQSMIKVCLSQHDYQQLCDENQNPLITMTQNDALAVGDVIIKTNTTEIRAILHDRIDQLLEVEHG